MSSKLTVRQGQQARSLSFQAPERLSRVLEMGGVSLAHPCGGRGKCGKCRAVITGSVSEPNEQERAFGARLMCQAVLLGDAQVSIPREADLEQIELGGCGEVFPLDAMPGRLGAAIDIGTTTLAVRVYDLTTGKMLGQLGAENPQRAFAADVMGRISAALAGNGQTLREQITDGLSSMLRQILSAAGRADERVDRLVITGNTTMLYLLTGQDVECLSTAPFAADRLFDEQLELLGGRAYLPPCISAFVGADITCAVLASGMCRTDGTKLLCDIGTNGELALWKDGQLYVTSTAAGPAFEGAGISCGCGSVRGAIDGVWTENGRLRVHTIGDAPAVGLCGSGLLDALAAFLELGVIDETGAAEDELLSLAPAVALTRADIRAAQLAKAAIAAGIETLLELANVRAEQVSELLIAGGFGGHINVSSAVRIGLIPRQMRTKVRMIGNGALAGAERLLLDRGCRAELDQIIKTARPIHLGGNSTFNERFIDHIVFGDPTAEDDG